MPRATREASEATAARIREVARRLFSEHGYAAIVLERVATEAAVTRGAIYHHYASKQGLFEAVLADTQSAVGEAVEAAASAHADPTESLRAGCVAFLRTSVHPDIRRIMLVDGPAVLGWAVWRGQDARHSARLLDDALAGLDRAGLLVPGALPAAGPLLSGAMNEAALWVAGSAHPEAALADAERALDLLLAAILTVAPAG